MKFNLVPIVPLRCPDVISLIRLRKKLRQQVMVLIQVEQEPPTHGVEPETGVYPKS